MLGRRRGHQPRSARRPQNSPIAWSRARVDRTLATDPTRRPRPAGLTTTVAPHGDVVPLFAMTADGDNTNFKTSLTQWGSALSVADQETLKQAQTGNWRSSDLARGR